MGQVQDEAKKLLKAFYDNWCTELLTFSRDGLGSKFEGVMGDGKVLIRARTYLVDNGYVQELPGSPMPKYRMHGKGIDAVENGTFV